MITITPQGNVYLCKTPLESDYKNQLTFTNLEAQENYFLSTVQKSYDEYTYIRKDNTITVGEAIDNIINCNYLFYRNTGFTNKYYYCFITKMEYVNENVTRIYIETDVFQTYQFDIVYNPSFIEREHVNNDGIGIHTVPENLELGEYIVNKVEDIQENNNYLICMGVSEIPSGLSHINDERYYGGLYSGLIYLLFDDATSCSKMIKGFDEAGKADGIYTIFMIPTRLSFSNTWYTATLGTQTDIRFSVVKTTTTPERLVNGKTIPINSTLNGYTPSNNKLFTYPYNYLHITNNSGGDAIYRYEDFSGNTPKFNIDGVITTGCSIKLYPLNYKKVNTNVWETACYNYGLNGGKYPTCSWKSDAYTNWLTQNSVNIGISLASSTLQLAGGIALSTTGVGSVAGASNISSGLLSIASTLGQVYEHSLVPDQAKGNTNNGDICFSNREITFIANQMSIRFEYAMIIDKFFTMFGYKINEVKVPNITGRTNFNYVKTIDNNFEGDIPQEYLRVIKNMFNNGITLWHNPSTMYNYNISNNIV